MDPKAVAESAEGRLSQMTGMKIPGYLDFDRNLTYEDGSVKFIGAEAHDQARRPRVPSLGERGARRQRAVAHGGQRRRLPHGQRRPEGQDRSRDLWQQRTHRPRAEPGEVRQGHDARLRRRHDLRRAARRALAAEERQDHRRTRQEDRRSGRDHRLGHRRAGAARQVHAVRGRRVDRPGRPHDRSEVGPRVPDRRRQRGEGDGASRRLADLR